TGRGEPLDPLVEMVDDVHGVVGCDGQARGAVELARIGALPAPLADERPIAVEDLDVVAELVRDVDVLVAVERDRRQPDELAVLGAVTAEVAEELLADRDDADPEPARRP